MRSVLVRLGTNHFSYLIPEGDDPKVGDYVMVILSSSDMFSEFVLGTCALRKIVKIEDPAHPKASKKYLTRYTEDQLREFFETNLMTDKIINSNNIEGSSRIIKKPTIHDILDEYDLFPPLGDIK